MYASSSFAYCFQFVNGISLGLAQSDPIKRRLPYKNCDHILKVPLDMLYFMYINRSHLATFTEVSINLIWVI